MTTKNYSAESIKSNNVYMLATGLLRKQVALWNCAKWSMTASLSWYNSGSGGGRAGDVTHQQVAGRMMAGTRDDTTTMTLEEEHVNDDDDEWQKLCEGDDDSDVFVDRFTGSVSCMLSDVEQSAFQYFSRIP